MEFNPWKPTVWISRLRDHHPKLVLDVAGCCCMLLTPVPGSGFWLGWKLIQTDPGSSQNISALPTDHSWICMCICIYLYMHIHIESCMSYDDCMTIIITNQSGIWRLPFFQTLQPWMGEWVGTSWPAVRGCLLTSSCFYVWLQEITPFAALNL